MSEQQRLFFALRPSEPVRNDLVHNTQDLLLASDGRAVSPANLHLTLAFLHNVDTDLLPCIADAAQRSRTEPFSLTFTHVGHWRRSGILWLGPERVPAALENLVQQLWQELAACGFTPEKRLFRPHITLARKVIGPVPADKVAPVQWPVTNFTLMQSITGQKQATYRDLATWQLL